MHSLNAVLWDLAVIDGGPRGAKSKEKKQASTYNGQ
jgi:hypothetical protein